VACPRFCGDTRPRAEDRRCACAVGPCPEVAAAARRLDDVVVLGERLRDLPWLVGVHREDVDRVMRAERGRPDDGRGAERRKNWIRLLPFDPRRVNWFDWWQERCRERPRTVSSPPRPHDPRTDAAPAWARRRIPVQTCLAVIPQDALVIYRNGESDDRCRALAKDLHARNASAAAGRTMAVTVTHDVA